MRHTSSTAFLLTLAAASLAMADTDGGIAALRARLGAASPTGAGVAVVQVEAPEATNAYAPDSTDPEFLDKTITKVTSPAVNSWHATSVGRFLYGSTSAMASGVTDAWAYNVADSSGWLSTVLKTTSGSSTVAPAAQPSPSVRVMNHSWIGSYGSANADINALRRIDFMMNRDGVLAVCGENNGAGSARQPLMGDTFNGLSVGRMDLQHSAGGTSASGDNPGRMKPDIIAPGIFTSFSTPVVGSAAALLFQTIAGVDFDLLTGLQKAQVVKACLLAGAERDAAWSNAAPQEGVNRGTTNKPVDPLRGSGLLNVDRSHRILTSPRLNGSTTQAGAVTAGSATGWGTAAITHTQKAWWRFNVNRPIAYLDFTLSWPRIVANNFGSYTMPNMNLRLWRIDGGTVPVALEGDAGLPYFAGGNVSCTSAVDNVETLHLVGLEPGEYMVEMSRVDVSSVAATAYAAWIMDEAAFGAIGDLDESGATDAGDIGWLLLRFGTSDPRGDLDRSGTVDAGDIAVLLLNFG